MRKPLACASQPIFASGRYYNDLFLIACFIQVGSMISDKFWYAALVVRDSLFAFRPRLVVHNESACPQIPGYLLYLAAQKGLAWVFNPTADEQAAEENGAFECHSPPRLFFPIPIIEPSFSCNAATDPAVQKKMLKKERQEKRFANRR